MKAVNKEKESRANGLISRLIHNLMGLIVKKTIIYRKMIDIMTQFLILLKII